MKSKKNKSLREVRSSVNAKPTNIQKKTTEKKETTPKEKKGPSTEEVKAARDERKAAAKNVNDVKAVITRKIAKYEHSLAMLSVEKLMEDGKTESRRSRKDYRKALRRARRTRQKLAKLNAAKDAMSTPKTYDVMVQYDSKMYPQVKELIEKMNLKTNIVTDTYFYIKIVDQKTLDEIKKEFSALKFEIMTKRRKVDDDGKPVMVKCKHADGTEYEKVETYLVPTGKHLTVHIHAMKHKELHVKTEKKKKPTHNTVEHKATVVGKHIALKQQRKTLAEWRKLMKAKRDEKQKEKEAKKKVNEQKKSITKAA